VGLTRIDPTTVVDDETGQTYYFPDLPEEDRAVPSVTRPTVDGLPRWVDRAAPEIEMPPEYVGGPPAEVSIGEAVVERPPVVSVGDAVIEEFPERPVPSVVRPGPDSPTLPMEGRLPPGVGAGSGPYTGTPMGPDEVRSRVAAATPPASPAARGASPPGPGGPLDPYSASGSAPAPAPARRGGIAGLMDAADASARDAARSGAAVRAEGARREAEGAREEANYAEQFAALQDREMRAAETRANARWEDWKRRADEAAASEINPERFWNSRTEFQKAAWIIALFAHGWVNVGKPNQIAELMQQHIDRDVAAQKENKAGRERGLEREADALARADRRDQDAIANRATAANLRIDALRRVTEARMKALGPAAAAADYQAVLAKLDEAKLSNEVALRKAQVDEEMDRARIAISRGNLALQRAQERRIAANDEAARRAAGSEDGPNLDPRLGLSTVLPDGTRVPGGWALTKSHEQASRVAQAAASGNKEYTALVGLREALRDQTLVDKLRSSDQSVRSEAIKLAYARARQLGGPGVLTDQDVDTAMKTVTGQSGLSAISYLVAPGDPTTLVEEGILTLKDRVNNELLGTGAVDVRRGALTWEPVLLEPRERPGKRTAEDSRAELSGKYGGESGVVPRRTAPLDIARPETDLVYATEKAAGKLPELAGRDAAGVSEIVTAGREAAARGDLAEIDRLVQLVDTSGLGQEARTRASLELRRMRIEASRAGARQRRVDAALAGERPGAFGIPVKYERP
jgi:hypothetical protein